MPLSIQSRQEGQILELQVAVAGPPAEEQYPVQFANLILRVIRLSPGSSFRVRLDFDCSHAISARGQEQAELVLFFGDL